MSNSHEARLRKFLAANNSMSPQAALTARLGEFGVDDVFELPIAQFYRCLIVPDEHVEKTKLAVYDCIPIGYRIDVIGRSVVDDRLAALLSSVSDKRRPNDARDAVEANR